MSKFVSISLAAQALGVSTSTLRRWEASGRLTPVRTEGGQRRYDLAALRPETQGGAQAMRKTVAYARVSSHDQKADLERQKRVLELYCASHGWAFDITAATVHVEARLPTRARRIAYHGNAARDVTGHHAAGADDRIIADGYTGKDDRAPPIQTLRPMLMGRPDSRCWSRNAGSRGWSAV